MQFTVNKLYGFIAKLVVLLEEELDDLRSNKSKSALNVKKNITDTLNKLVTLIIQLNKLNQDVVMSSDQEMTLEDQEIIERFLSKYK